MQGCKKFIAVPSTNVAFPFAQDAKLAFAVQMVRYLKPACFSWREHHCQTLTPPAKSLAESLWPYRSCAIWIRHH